MFWNCWGNYFLPKLISRANWTISETSLSKNHLVIIKSFFFHLHGPLLTALISKILDIYPGSDGVVRSVKIKQKQMGN